MIDLMEIKKRIGDIDSKTTMDYFGFNMGKTHSQEKTNEGITEYNIEVLKRFEDYLDVDYISQHLDCWKGTMYWEENLNDKHYDDIFGGWTTAQIILWLIENHSKKKQEPIREICKIVTREQRYKVLKRQKWRCNSCNCILKFSVNSEWKGEIAHIDHIHAYSKRDSYIHGPENINEIENLQALCEKCNLKKKAKNG